MRTAWITKQARPYFKKKKVQAPDGSAVRSTGMIWDLIPSTHVVELSIMSVLCDPVPFSGLHRYQKHTCRQNNHSHKIFLKSKVGGEGWDMVNLGAGMFSMHSVLYLISNTLIHMRKISHVVHATMSISGTVKFKQDLLYPIFIYRS